MMVGYLRDITSDNLYNIQFMDDPKFPEMPKREFPDMPEKNFPDFDQPKIPERKFPELPGEYEELECILKKFSRN